MHAIFLISQVSKVQSPWCQDWSTDHVPCEYDMHDKRHDSVRVIDRPYSFCPMPPNQMEPQTFHMTPSSDTEEDSTVLRSEIDGTVTGSYRSDIVLFSAWLDGSQPDLESSAQAGPKANTSLNFLSHISTLLTTGSSSHPQAENVHAVSGNIQEDIVHCLIFAANTPPTHFPQRDFHHAIHSRSITSQQLQGAINANEAAKEKLSNVQKSINAAKTSKLSNLQAMELAAARKAAKKAGRVKSSAQQEVKKAERLYDDAQTAHTFASAQCPSSFGAQAGGCNLLPFIPDTQNGEKLLKKWGGNAAAKCVIVSFFCLIFLNPLNSDINFDKHMKEVFDILAYLRSPGLQCQPLFIPWQAFIHHRAFRKVAHRMHILQTHWDMPPFDILRDNETLVSAAHALKRSFEIKVHKESVDMINKFVRSEQSGGSYNVRSFAVDKGCLRGWIQLFRTLWKRLQKYLMKSLENGKWKPRTDPPDEKTVMSIVRDILCMRKLRPVIEHLFGLTELQTNLFILGELLINLSKQYFLHL